MATTWVIKYLVYSIYLFFFWLSLLTGLLITALIKFHHKTMVQVSVSVCVGLIIIMNLWVTYITEKIERLRKSYVQHTNALSKQLIKMLPEMLQR